MSATKTSLAYRLKLLYRKAFLESTGQTEKDLLPAANRISRKEFLSNSTMAGASLLVPGFLQSAFANEPGKKVSVAIVGGGIAGLNACRILSKKDWADVSVYEASKRTGGRIYTAKNLMGENLTTELGGEFVDTEHKEMLELIDDFDLEKYDCVADIRENNLPDHIYFFGEKERTEQEVIDAFKKIIPAVQLDKGKINEDATGALDKLSLKAYLKKLKVTGWFYNLLYWAYTAEFGLDASELNCLCFIDMVGIDTSDGFKIFGSSDERFKIRGGNQSLIDKMTDKLKNHINYSYKLVSMSKQGNKTALVFENRQTVLADYVLLAIPFSVLRNVTINPNLQFPAIKKKMITQLGYGTNSKLFLGFNSRKWRDDGSSGYMMNEEIQNGWDNTQLQNDNKGRGGFTVFLGGLQGKNLSDTPANREKYLNRLNKVFKGTKAQYNSTHAIFNWPSNPFAKGSYACCKVGQWNLFDTEEMMRPVGNIFFAGEHCSLKFQGFMEGGAETGKMAAEAMIEQAKEKDKDKSFSSFAEKIFSA